MNKYELAIVLRADLDEDSMKADIERIHKFIARFEGTIDKIDDWGRRRLAYEIEKQNEGFYSFITFTSPAGAPAEIEKRIRIMENVLRFLIVRLEA